MCSLPRLAIGAIQPEADSQPIVWAMLDAFEQRGVRAETFFSRACFRPRDGAIARSGNKPRHLDSWLMTPEVCRQSFLQATANKDLAVVEGRYDQADAAGKGGRRGGSLDALCEWLDLPRVAVVDLTLLNHCQIPPRPVANRLVLDRANGRCDFYRWQTILESLWGIPVIGGMDECGALRKQITSLLPGQRPTADQRAALTQQFLRYSSIESILKFTARRGVSGQWPMAVDAEHWSVPRSNVRVAVAYDDAFHCYFSETFDLLEARGATVRVFSPLRDECLPSETDIVYLGCGSPHDHAAALADNHCMLMALKEHVCSGRRIYAEGGGLAYLCQHLETADGKRTPMVGAIRAIARRNPERQTPEPVEVMLAIDSWLGEAGTKLRGYRNANWQLEPSGCLTSLAGEAEHRFDLVARHQAIASRIHLNFATQPLLLGGFLRPCPEALAWGAAL